MARSNPRIIYGVHSATPYDRTTGLPYGTMEVLGGSSFSLAGELAELNGGSTKFPVAVEDTVISAELSLKPKEYPEFLFELFLGKAPTKNVAEANGNASALVNKNGASVFDGTTGIASVGVKAGSESDLKTGSYVIEAVSATTVMVYCLSSVDFGRGTSVTYENDDLEIIASPLTITASGTVDIPNFGLELTGGSGTIGMTIGDTATFEVRSINQGSIEVTVGGSSDVYPEFGLIAMSQKRGNGALVELDIFRLKAIGLPLNLEEKAFSEAEITAKAFYDAEKNGVFKTTSIDEAL